MSGSVLEEGGAQAVLSLILETSELKRTQNFYKQRDEEAVKASSEGEKTVFSV